MLGSIFGVNFWSLFTIMVVLGWVGPFYTTRSYIIMAKDREYVQAAKSIGASKLRLVLSHALPAILGKVLYTAVVRIPSVVFSVSSLAFFGLIEESNSYNLGVIINTARGDFKYNH